MQGYLNVRSAVNMPVVDIYRTLIEMRDNCMTGGAYDDPKRLEKRDALNAAMDMIGNLSSLNTLRDEIYQDAVAHGLWEIEDAIKFAEDHHGLRGEVATRHVCAAMIAGELFELDEESIKGDAYAEELADVIIMSLSVAGKLGIDIDAAVGRKMAVNKERPWKHGRE